MISTRRPLSGTIGHYRGHVCISKVKYLVCESLICVREHLVCVFVCGDELMLSCVKCLLVMMISFI